MSFPEKLDLREHGLVTEVKSQKPWGSCWSFGTIAASESSILSMLGMTAEDYEARYGKPFDLSERHLAWFMAHPLPDASAYSPEEYPYDPSQAGEGLYPLKSAHTDILELGGNMMFSTFTLAAGMGVVEEELAPYQSKEGTLQTEDDWSLDESMRFTQLFELKDANILPSPAGRDAENKYIYQPEGTESMKSELMKGRAVLLTYTADTCKDDPDLNDPEGWPLTYVCQVEYDGALVYAQYTDDELVSDHVVCVVGWDDAFPASAFPQAHRPPADGAWIVKNSWGESWGNAGYFYLSYYDKCICSVETFEFIHPDDVKGLDHPNLLQYDYLPSALISSTLFDKPVYAANVFPVQEGSVLQYVSAMTGDGNANVTVSIYRMGENAAAPDDGQLLCSVTQRFPFAGYHRISLPESLILHAGERIGITVLERVGGTDGAKYALVNACGLNEKGAETFAANQPKEIEELERYWHAVVNPGESFVRFPGEDWIDWAEVIAALGNNPSLSLMTFDNLPIKSFVYPLDQAVDSHRFEAQGSDPENKVMICTECGYVLK